MVTIDQETVWRCRRDYWRLEVFRPPLEANRRLVSLCGRRRTTEAFGPPVVMDDAALARLSGAFESAIAVATGFQAVGIRDCPGKFPSRQHLARCCGAFYQLDIYGTVVEENIESVELAVVVPATGRRPVLELIDADIEVFAADLLESLEVISGRCHRLNGRKRPS